MRVFLIHATSIYRVMHQTAPPFEIKMFYQAKLMNQSNVSPSKAYKSKYVSPSKEY